MGFQEKLKAKRVGDTAGLDIRSNAQNYMCLMFETKYENIYEVKTLVISGQRYFSIAVCLELKYGPPTASESSYCLISWEAFLSLHNDRSLVSRRAKIREAGGVNGWRSHKASQVLTSLCKTPNR